LDLVDSLVGEVREQDVGRHRFSPCYVRIFPFRIHVRLSVAALHSITSSARASSDGGTSTPSALAVLRLITSSYLIGAWTGRSAGFSPLRISLTTPSGASEAIGYNVPGLRHDQQVGPLFFR